MSNISERIRTVRKKLELTQTEFATMMGLTMRGVQRWENNEVKIRQSSVELVCNTFDINPAWLLTGQGEMFLSKEMHSDFVEDERIKGSSAHNLVYHAVKKMSKSEAEEILKYIEERELLKEARKNKELTDSMRKKVKGE